MANGCVVVCGGWLDDSRFLGSVEIRGDQGEWSLSQPHLRVGRCNHGAASVNGSIFVIGGYDDLAVEKWDPRDSSGFKLALEKVGEWHLGFGVAPFQDDIIVLGGNRDNKALSGKFDCRANKWTEIKPMPRNNRWHYSCSLLSNGQIIVVGGDDGIKEIDSYNPVADSWTTLELGLLLDRQGFQALSF